MTCFRCLEKRDDFRVMFEVVKETKSMRQIATERSCFVEDVQFPNTSVGKEEDVLKQLTTVGRGVSPLPLEQLWIKPSLGCGGCTDSTQC